MEERSETLSSKKEFAFASSTILSQVGRGIWLCWSRRRANRRSFSFSIEKGFHLLQGLYQDWKKHLVRNLFIIGLFYVIVCWLSAKLTRRSEKDIKGSGIPQVSFLNKGTDESQLVGVSSGKKYILGILAIASGLMLGREGPSTNLEQLVVVYCQVAQIAQ